MSLLGRQMNCQLYMNKMIRDYMSGGEEQLLHSEVK